MKVVFLKDMPKVAQAGEVKDVADGYGRNFLLPKGFVTLATPAALKKLEHKRQVEIQSQAQSQEEAQALAEKLRDFPLTLKARVGAKGRLYGSITASDITQELKRQTGYELDKRKIELEPIHQLGEYEVLIKLAKGVAAKIKVTVEGE